MSKALGRFLSHKYGTHALRQSNPIMISTIRQFSLKSRPTRSTLISSSCRQISVPRAFNRGFQQIPVRSERGKRLIRYSRVLLALIGVFYGVSLGYPLAVVAYYSYMMQGVQKVPDSWPLNIRLLAWAAIGQEVEQNYVIAVRYYKSLIEELDKLVGPDEDVMNKPKSWLEGYADIKMRLGLVESWLGNDEDAKTFLLQGYIYGPGDKILKSKTAIVLSQLAAQEGHDEDAENLLKEAIQWVVPESIAIKFEDPSWCPEAPENLRISDPQIAAFMELGNFYAFDKRNLQRALTIFLSVARAMRNYKDAIELLEYKKDLPEYIDRHCYEAQLQSHISEVLWALGLYKDSIIWGEEAYVNAHSVGNITVECGMCAKLAASNLAKMYKQMGIEHSANKFEQVAEQEKVPLFNPSPNERWRVIFW